MGAAHSTQFSPHFEVMKQWSWSRVNYMIQNFVEQEYDFGIDVNQVATLTELSQTESHGIIKSLSRNDSGIVNAISLLCIIILISDCLNRLETARLNAIFDLVDFNQAGKISLDELNILLISLSNAITVMIERKDAPSEEIITTLTLNMYDQLKKAPNSTISKQEFTQWMLSTLGGLENCEFETFYDTLCLGGPIVEEEEPDDGIPKLMTEVVVTTGKQINRRPVKKEVFSPYTGKYSSPTNSPSNKFGNAESGISQLTESSNGTTTNNIIDSLRL